MEWPEVPFLSVCGIQGGTQPPKSKFIRNCEEGYVRLLQIQDFKRDDKACFVPDIGKLKKCKDDDVLIARYGASLGKILTGKSGAYNVALVKTLPNLDKLTKRYLYYFLLSPSFQNFISKEGRRAAQAGFNKENLSRLTIKLPSLEEQKRITDILDKAYAINELSKKTPNIRNLLLNSIFSEMFGKKLVSTIYVNSFIQLSSLSRKTKNLNPFKYPNDEFELYSIPAYDLGVPENIIGSEIGSNKKILIDNDVVISKIIPHIRRVWIISESNGEVMLGSSEWIVFNSEKFNSIYLKYLLSSDEFNKYFMSTVAGVGGSLVRARLSVVSKLFILCPGLEEQNKFADYVTQIERMPNLIDISLTNFNSISQVLLS